MDQTKQAMPEDYPFNEWTWHNELISKQALEKQPPCSREEMEAQIKAQMQVMERRMSGRNG